MTTLSSSFKILITMRNINVKTECNTTGYELDIKELLALIKLVSENTMRMLDFPIIWKKLGMEIEIR